MRPTHGDVFAVGVCRQHELPPGKSRTVSVQAHGSGGRWRREGVRRFPGTRCGGPPGRQGLFPGGASLPLRGEPQEREHQEAGL